MCSTFLLGSATLLVLWYLLHMNSSFFEVQRLNHSIMDSISYYCTSVQLYKVQSALLSVLAFSHNLMERHGNFFQLNKQCPYTIRLVISSFRHKSTTLFLWPSWSEKQISSRWDLLPRNTIKLFFLSSSRCEHLWFYSSLIFQTYAYVFSSFLFLFSPVTSLLSPPELPVASCLRTLLPESTTAKPMPGQCDALLYWYFWINWINVMWKPI